MDNRRFSFHRDFNKHGPHHLLEPYLCQDNPNQLLPKTKAKAKGKKGNHY
jgi:hypothetical protein